MRPSPPLREAITHDTERAPGAKIYISSSSPDASSGRTRVRMLAPGQNVRSTFAFLCALPRTQRLRARGTRAARNKNTLEYISGVEKRW